MADKNIKNSDNEKYVPLITQVDDISTPVDDDMPPLVAGVAFIAPEPDEVIYSGTPDGVMARSDTEAKESSDSNADVTVVDDCRPKKTSDGFAVERKALKRRIRWMESQIATLIANKESVAVTKKDFEKKVAAKNRRYAKLLKEYNLLVSKYDVSFS